MHGCGGLPFFWQCVPCYMVIVALFAPTKMFLRVWCGPVPTVDMHMLPKAGRGQQKGRIQVSDQPVLRRPRKVKVFDPRTFMGLNTHDFECNFFLAAESFRTQCAGASPGGARHLQAMPPPCM
jgi:hypothetical protein